MLNRFDRYSSFLFWGYFLGSILIFTTLFLAVDAMSTLVKYKGLSGEVVASYYFYFLPEVLHKMLPVACVLGVVLTLSNLNRNNELVALYASGMSLFRISFPLLVSTVLICLFSLILSDKILPQATKQKNYIFYTLLEKTPGKFSTVKTDRIWYRSKNAIFNIKTLNVQGTKAQGLTLYFLSEDWDLLQMLTAKEVELNGSQWLLKNGSITLLNADSSFPLSSQFKSKKIVMSEDSKDLQSSGQTSEMLSQKELAQFISKNKVAGLDTLRYEVDYHSKFGFAFAGLVMALLGIPFSVTRARTGGSMANIGICLALVFAYWILYSSGLTLGQHGHLPPVLAAWAPNFIMGGLAVWILIKSKK
ncbi:MAG: LPS export ABC transporter permease LptG [Pseudobdellovibrionaceae bacterium]